MSNTKSKLLTTLKVIYLIIYIALTAYLVWGLLDIVITPSSNPSLEVAVYLTIVVIIIGGIGYIVSLIPAIIGLIYSIVKRAGKGNIIFFIVAIILPIISEIAFIVTCQMLA